MRRHRLYVRVGQNLSLTDDGLPTSTAPKAHHDAHPDHSHGQPIPSASASASASALRLAASIEVGTSQIDEALASVVSSGPEDCVAVHNHILADPLKLLVGQQAAPPLFEEVARWPVKIACILRVGVVFARAEEVDLWGRVVLSSAHASPSIRDQNVSVWVKNDGCIHLGLV